MYILTTGITKEMLDKVQKFTLKTTTQQYCKRSCTYRITEIYKLLLVIKTDIMQ